MNTKNAKIAYAILRITIAIILLSHSVLGMFDGGINDFGNLYLNKVGFAPYGVAIAWIIKLSHVVCAVLLIMNKYIRLACFATIFVLIMGIIMVHLKEGWFVVGGGRNGVEYNFVLLCVLTAIMFLNADSKQYNTKIRNGKIS
ncbi:DoxX family protein [Pedobacter ginsenosidimutans]|uniref:DoxX family protein n=1 Tax=Pedobacter ginsenosidimutans TaxID=687842 RepID=A0A0T5VLL2_9SPHI|nr:DoxX family protein [Pedobacter ginsenosidimutans]KRT14736.1 DoxX family protein [Pedobacter ginsenosidimutans]